MAMSVARRRFTVEEYERMADVGILVEDDRVELLEGEIVEMAPIGPAHAGCVNRLIRAFAALLGDKAVVSAQNPIRLDPTSEPQPAVVLLRPRPDFYSSRHPEPGDVLLVVEVPAATAPFDRQVKLPLYAAAGIAQAWLVDVTAGGIEVYRLSSARSYGDAQFARGSDEVAIDAFPGLSLTADQILG